ncbi:MAG: sensor histidine kinase [Candidatus Avoscillospira sp.]
MNKQTHIWRKSRISQRLSMQFLLSVFAYLLMLFGGYFLAYLLCAQHVWQADDKLYWFLKTLQYLSPALILIAVLAGLFFITRHFFSVPLRYLDAVVAAAEQLAVSPETPVQLPEALRDTENELNLVREQSLRAAYAAREAEQRKNDLVVYLAHDLKTPLTSVLGYLTLLQEEPDLSPALRDRYTGVALDKARRLEDLINEFFDITRFNLTHLELNLAQVDLTRMLEQITYEFLPVLAEKDMTWDLHLSPAVRLSCDPDKLQRVFDNLFRNAVNYGYSGTAIAVSLELRADAAEVRVQNHGRTIPPEKLDRIFEQFYRLDAARSTTSGGSGLGLAIAKEIVELHGGTIRAASEADSVLFTVTLPMGQDTPADR